MIKKVQSKIITVSIFIFENNEKCRVKINRNMVPYFPLTRAWHGRRLPGMWQLSRLDPLLRSGDHLGVWGHSPGITPGLAVGTHNARSGHLVGVHFGSFFPSPLGMPCIKGFFESTKTERA